jgi:hypothetical protein
VSRIKRYRRKKIKEEEPAVGPASDSRGPSSCGLPGWLPLLPGWAGFARGRPAPASLRVQADFRLPTAHPASSTAPRPTGGRLFSGHVRLGRPRPSLVRLRGPHEASVRPTRPGHDRLLLYVPAAPCMHAWPAGSSCSRTGAGQLQSFQTPKPASTSAKTQDKHRDALLRTTTRREDKRSCYPIS